MMTLIQQNYGASNRTLPLLLKALLSLSPLIFSQISLAKTTAPKCAFSISESSIGCTFRPISRFALSGVRIEAPALVSQTMWSVSSLSLGDSVLSDGTAGQVNHDPRNAFNFQARLGLNIDTRKKYFPFIFSAHYEQDFISGFFRGGESEADAIALPLEQNPEYNAIRKAYARLTLGPFLTVSAGRMTSHWGLGLLANDGAHGWQPKSAYFGDPRGGDRVNRVLLATGPWTRKKIIFSMAYDKVASDDILLNEDQAEQIILAAIYGYKKTTQIGAYVVQRTQDIPQTIEGINRQKETKVNVYDIYAKTRWRLPNDLKLYAEFEGVVIDGTTTLAPSPEFPKNDVVQLALATKLKLEGSRAGLVLDMIYASGDQNFDDGSQNGFKADPNYELGLLLFRHVIASHTGRAPITASDPNLVGRPSEDLDRFPSRGSVTNTIAVFPRAWARLTDGLEVYGGPLVAWGDVPLADPRNTRFNGGYPINLLGGQGGTYLGTELDLGLRFLMDLGGVARVNIGFEGAVFLPGNAFKSSGESMAQMYGGRLMAHTKF
jgi:hypothetical protein